MTTADETGVPAEAGRLDSFLGTWTVEGTLAERNEIAAVSGDWKFRPALDGWGVLGDLATSIEGLGEFAETEVVGFDASTFEVHLFSANRFAIRDHVGEWVDPDQLTVRWVGTGEDGAVVEEITISFDRPGHMSAKVVESAGPAVTATTDLTLTRATPPSS